MERENSQENVKLSAKEYIEKHNIKNTIMNMQNSLLHERPFKPQLYMVRIPSINLNDLIKS